jgi:hypothetical protein
MLDALNRIFLTLKPKLPAMAGNAPNKQPHHQSTAEPALPSVWKTTRILAAIILFVKTNF